MDTAVEGALQSARLERSSISAAFCALAGADLREDFDRLHPALATLNLAPVVELENDSIAAMWSGTDAPDAVVVVWGAGTNGAGRNRAGMRIRLPALGSISGDWGGGGDFGREAIWYVARAHDGRGEPTLLVPLVLDALEIDTVDEMIRRLYFKQILPAQIIALAPLVFNAANADDPVAREVVVRGGKEVATTARALLARLDLLSSPVPVVLAGGMFRADSPIFHGAIRHALEQSAPCAHIVRPDVEPVVGAALAALNLLGVPADPAMRARARATYRHAAPL